MQGKLWKSNFKGFYENVVQGHGLDLQIKPRPREMCFKFSPQILLLFLGLMIKAVTNDLRLYFL